ncbi:MAG: non-canonical purine NTP pyrophosphatase, partial [Candidatus Omnitrophica bacterium]|nr:non-canonical purine NTP pyrophosphatase [Candidatus Omnitrophota bacterium]
MNKLLVATRNLGKLKEIKSLLRDIDVTIISFNDIDKSIDDIDETGTTFKDNAIEKAREVAKKAHCLTLADDSGLCIDALEGAPGVYSARFAGSAKDNEKNRQKVLFLMKEA